MTAIDDEKLMAYADGELDAEMRAELEAAFAKDELLRERAEMFKRVRRQIADAYADVLDEPLPESLRLAAGGAVEQPQAHVIDLSARRQQKTWGAREWGAMAASLAGGLIIGFGAMNMQAPPFVATADGIRAAGALDRALSTQLASESARAVRIGLSFRSHDGRYCRTFELNLRATAGIACRGDDGWDVALTATQPNQSEVRMAGVSPAILDTVEQLMDGDPLDAEAEAQARARGWRTASP